MSGNTKQRILQLTGDGNRSCAFYRMPGEKEVHYICSARAVSVPSFAELGTQRGFVVAPFVEGVSSPLVFIPADAEGVFAMSDNFVSEAVRPKSVEVSRHREAYGEQFSRCLQLLRSGRLHKIVLARAEQARIPASTFGAADLFLLACEAYPDNFVSLIATPQTAAWVMATPEPLLLRTGRTSWRTVALAGTMTASLAAGLSVEEWSEKNRREQRLVSDELMKRLRPFVADLRCSPVRVSRSGDLLHLRTDIDFTADNLSAGSLLKILQRTPATCGLPAEEACSNLLSIEGEVRRYYAGFCGPCGGEEGDAFFANLRCARFNDALPGVDGFTLYAGSGLLEESDEQQEWEETERKLDALLKLLR